MSDSLRVLVLDAEPVLLAGVKAALNAHGVVIVATVCDGADAVELARIHRPDACLVGSSTGDGDALDVVRGLREVAPSTTVLMFGECEDVSVLAAALRAGACGYLSKDVDLDRLASVLKAACCGEPVVSRRLVAQLLAPAGHTGAQLPVPRQRTPTLTPREAEVLVLLHRGHSTAGIAHLLGVARVTVRTHIMAIVRKQHVKDRHQLVP